MKRQLLVAAIALGSLGAIAADTDPVLITIDGKPVTVSEFEYLYNKNKTQQAQEQSLDDYMQMFIDFKLKVADAEHAGITHDPGFQREYNSYKYELSAPYLRINSVEDALVDEAYSHQLENVYVSHIMRNDTPVDRARMDSIRNEILAGRAMFEDMARQFSIDGPSARRGGMMGYVTPSRFPWEFEKASYDTPVGQISPVIASGFGLHIIRPESRKPAEGEVEASHILMLTRGLSDEEVAKQKVRIDSIYDALQDGADFADLAKGLSQDPGSARNGGKLGWFGRGQMVADFDSAAFAIKDGEISKPFASTFGYHIIYRTGHRGIAPKEQMRQQLIDGMKEDSRGDMAEKAFADSMRTRLNLKADEKGLAQVRKMIEENPGKYDSTAIAALSKADFVIYTFNGGNVTVAEVMPNIMRTASRNVDNAMDLIQTSGFATASEKILDIARDELAQRNRSYRDLVNEYRDGILLYEVSKQKVWDKAAADTEGLDKFFRANKNKYTWKEPKFKSFIIFASNDSILNEALKYAESLDRSNPAEFSKQMREHFKREVKVERVIAAKGENPITDYLAFGGPKPDDKKSRWTSYAKFGDRMISAPEEPADLRGAVVSDYQTYLNDEWVKELRKKYKVKINDKVFKQLKNGK